jgi:DNA-binding GntR family transcriptional regulator
MPLSAVQAKVAREIVALARRENLPAGERLPELVLAEKIGTSRSPVNAALRHLARLGVATYDRNRGFFLARPAGDLGGVMERLTAAGDDPLYFRIADDRLNRRLPDEITETELMRRYRTSRNDLRKVLGRILEEGWIERRMGHGWAFLPMIDSIESYEQSYHFRRGVEPMGLLSPSFLPDRDQLAALRREQERIVAGGHATMTAIELFESNSRFHETLAAWSGNAFIVHAVRRVNLLRRLVDYKLATNRAPRATQAAEHLGILNAIEAGDMLRAASLMREHLEGARRGLKH